MKEIVEAGYDAMADHYLTWSAEIVDDPRLHYLDDFDSRLNDNARIVELGCGAGVPVTKKLTERHDVLGVEMFFGSNTPAENRALLGEHFEIITDDLVTMHEPDPATFHRVLTRKS